MIKEAENRSTSESFIFGDGIDWSSPLEEVMLYVELPFWLMTPPGPVQVVWHDTEFTVNICSPWQEIFVGEVTDSRSSVRHQGPQLATPWQPEGELALALAENNVSWLPRPCKTMLRLAASGHASAFRQLDDTAIPRWHAEQEAYRASLCEAHLPVVNELIQSYRLLTYDYFPYEVSAWDVPLWYVKHAGQGYRTSLVRYKDWDRKPAVVGENQVSHTFAFTSPADMSGTRSAGATPGEFDLLDARSLMERGDYTGAVRRTVTAVEAVLRWALKNELGMRYDEAEAERRTANTDNDFPGRLAQWLRLAEPGISQVLFDEFERTRELRHAIVHKALRLTLHDRGRAQRAVDTSRWLYNKIESKPERERLREFGGVIRAVGRVDMSVRFDAKVRDGAIVLSGIDLHPEQ